MDPVHREVPQPDGAERAPVARAVAQDAPRVEGVRAVLDGDLRHLREMIRLDLADAVRDRADPVLRSFALLHRASLSLEPNAPTVTLGPSLWASRLRRTPHDDARVSERPFGALHVDVAGLVHQALQRAREVGPHFDKQPASGP